MVRQLCRLFSVFVVILFWSGDLALAQSQARLTGVVTDGSGAVIVGAQVTARNVATGLSYPSTTNSSGAYVLPLLPPGAYELNCEMAGYKKFAQSGVVLETGFARALDIRLEVGEVTETVNVQAATPLLESETSSVGQLIERAQVANLPVESRRAASLIRLMGAVVYREELQGSGEAIPAFSMAGGRSVNQMWLLDGAVVQNMALGAPLLVVNPPAEALQEFKAEATNYAAEFGRTGGGLILMTTRSGTNQFHGAAYEFLRNDRLDARTFFAPTKAPLRYNVFGASLGGPVLKNTTFFFFNYEGARRREGGTAADTDVPHPAEINGDFSARQGLRVIDPMTGQPFPNNIIPANRIDPIGQAVARLYPAPNHPGNDVTRAPVDNFIANFNDRLDQDFITGRLDHSFSNVDRVYLRYSFVRSLRTLGPIYPQAFADFRARRQNNSHNNVVFSSIHNFSSNLINEARYLYSTRLNITQTAGTGSGKNGEIGIRGVNPNTFAQIAITGLSSFGLDGQERLQTPILTHQVADNLTWLKGKHQVKTGFEFRYSRNQDDFNSTFGGSFTFNDRATGNGLASLLLGHVTAASLTDTDVLNSRTDYYGAFLQDDWKIGQRLTLNLGLRWELDTPRWETNNRQSGFDARAINPVAGVPGVVTFSGRDGRSKYAHDTDKNNFSPRFGFAWRLRDNLVVRGGYGLVYNGAYDGAVPFVLFNGFGLNGSFTSPDGGLTPAFAFRNGMPPIVREEIGPGLGAVRVGQSPRLSPDFIVQDHRNSYHQQWNLTVQKQLLGSSVFELAYLGNVAHKLGGPNVNLNMVPLVNGRGPDRQSQQARPFPHFNNVTQISPPWGNSSYHAMNVKLEKRYSGGLNFLMNYTWSKFLDDVEARNELGGEAGNGYTHIELRRLDKSYSGNDIRHRYVASGVYELPFGKGRHWPIRSAVLDHIAGGWGVGAITEFRSGPPYGVLEQTNLTNTFSHAQRPNLIRDPKIPGDRSRGDMLAGYFDTSAFQAPGAGVFGNAPRNQGFAPGFIGIDISVHKRWALNERIGFSFRSDFFNAPNRPNFGSPGLLRGRGDFGRIASLIPGATGRLIQLSGRVEF